MMSDLVQHLGLLAPRRERNLHPGLLQPLKVAHTLLTKPRKIVLLS